MSDALPGRLTLAVAVAAAAVRSDRGPHRTDRLTPSGSGVTEQGAELALRQLRAHVRTADIALLGTVVCTPRSSRTCASIRPC